MFKQFMEVLEEIELELGKKLKDFTVNDFFELETEMEEELFKDKQVIAKLKECAAITEIKKDTKSAGTFIKLIDGSEGVFGI